MVSHSNSVVRQSFTPVDGLCSTILKQDVDTKDLVFQVVFVSSNKKPLVTSAALLVTRTLLVYS